MVTYVCATAILQVSRLVTMPEGNACDGSRAVGYIEPQVLAHLADSARGVVVD